MTLVNFTGINSSLTGGLSGGSTSSTVAGRLWTPSTWKLQGGVTTTGTFGGGISETGPSALWWNASGSIVYFSGTTSGQLKSYTVGSSTFDLPNLSGGSSASSTILKAVDGITNVVPRAIALSADGLNLFSVSATTNKLYKHTLGTAFSPATLVATAAQENALNFATATSPDGMSFIETGGACKFMFANSAANPAIQVYSMNAAFDLTTCAQVSTVATPVANPLGCCWMDSGNKMAILNFVTGNVRCYTTASAYTVPALTTSSHYDSIDLTQFGFAGSTFTDIQFNTAGTRMYLTDTIGDRMVQFGMV